VRGVRGRNNISLYTTSGHVGDNPATRESNPLTDSTCRSYRQERHKATSLLPSPKIPSTPPHPPSSVCTRAQTKSFSHFANICSFVIAFSRKSILHMRENGVNKFTKITNIYAKLFSLYKEEKNYVFCPSMHYQKWEFKTEKLKFVAIFAIFFLLSSP
jgi:hypothetical protein